MKTLAPMSPDTNATESANAVFDRRMVQIGELVKTHHQYLVNVVYRRIGNYQDAEDVVSRLWVYVLKHPKFEAMRSLPQLRRKAHFLSLDLHRSRKNKEVLLENFDELPMVARPDNPATAEEEARLERNFWSELPDLPVTEEQKKATWLKVRYGYTVKEISQQLGSAPATVGDWIAKTKQAIVDYLNNSEPQ